jgi:hypothetical protein
MLARNRCALVAGAFYFDDRRLSTSMTLSGGVTMAPVFDNLLRRLSASVQQSTPLKRRDRLGPRVGVFALARRAVAAAKTFSS